MKKTKRTPPTRGTKTAESDLQVREEEAKMFMTETRIGGNPNGPVNPHLDLKLVGRTDQGSKIVAQGRRRLRRNRQIVRRQQAGGTPGGTVQSEGFRSDPCGNHQTFTNETVHAGPDRRDRRRFGTRRPATPTRRNQAARVARHRTGNGIPIRSLSGMRALRDFTLCGLPDRSTRWTVSRTGSCSARR